MSRLLLSLLTASSLALFINISVHPDAAARFPFGKKQKAPAVTSTQSGLNAKHSPIDNSKHARTQHVKTTVSSPAVPPQQQPDAQVPDDSCPNSSAPFVVPPSELDVTTARFGKLEIELKDAAFLEAKVREMHLIADHLDMSSGILSSLEIKMEGGDFEDFTVDYLGMKTQGNLHFNIGELVNNKVLQFLEPATAEAKVIINQASLNNFLNSTKVLHRLSGSAKKRVPLLSKLAKQDVNFGFTFTGGQLKLEPDNRMHLQMHSKLGLGNGGVPVSLAADTKLVLQDGWVNLTDTHLLTGGQTVPHDLAGRIVNRINELSKWGKASDDIQFEFTHLTVIPDERLELQGTAQIKRIRFQRASAADAVNAATGSTTPAPGSTTPAPGSTTPAPGSPNPPTSGSSPAPESLRSVHPLVPETPAGTTDEPTGTKPGEPASAP